MKKNLVYIIILILACALSSGITYYFIVNHKPEEPSKPIEKNPEEEDINVVLKESELIKYLEYVPKDYRRSTRNAYKTKIISDETEKSILLGATINYAEENTTLKIKNPGSEEYYYNKNDISKLLLKLYNQELDDLENSNEAIAEFNSSTYYYNNNLFRVVNENKHENNHVNYIDSYEATDKELIIYEHAAMYIESNENECENPSTFNDYQKDYIFKFPATLNEAGTCTYNMEHLGLTKEEYFETLKDDFTKYKHTFKKNSAGYYWYSTEIA